MYKTFSRSGEALSKLRVPNKASVVLLREIVRGKLWPIFTRLSGNASMEKKMPEKKIDVSPTKKFITFPTLNRIINDAANNPIPI